MRSSLLQYKKGFMMLLKKTFIFLFMMFAVTSIMAGHAQRHQIVDGLSVYFGAIPAQLIVGHGSMHLTKDMKKGKNTYHILVALFDRAQENALPTLRSKPLLYL